MLNFGKMFEIKLEKKNINDLYDLDKNHFLIGFFYQNETIEFEEYYNKSKYMVDSIPFSYMINDSFSIFQKYIKKILNKEVINKESGIFYLNKLEKTIIQIPMEYKTNFEDWLQKNIFSKESLFELNTKNLYFLLKRPLLILFCKNIISDEFLKFKKISILFKNQNFYFSYLIS
jgi:hypothetical protein